MNRALAGCLSCGFVTRRHSHIGAGGRCPKCSGPLTETTRAPGQTRSAERRILDRGRFDSEQDDEAISP